MFWNKIQELEKRIERLEYTKPESLESFYNRFKYTKIDDLYWLDQEWFIEELNRYRCLIYRDGACWKIQMDYNGRPSNYHRGQYVGEIYESYIWLRDCMVSDKIESKKKK